MKIFCETPPDLSKAMGRVVAALKREAPPGVQFVRDANEADLIVLHVIGFPETEVAVHNILNHNKKYAIIQYCMRSTQEPHTSKWRDIWSNAQLVWSYYDLPAMGTDDGVSMMMPFYFAPMGVDPIFMALEPQHVKMWTLLTSGYVAESESVTEAAAAVYARSGKHFHLGPQNVAPHAHRFGIGISDYQLAMVYIRTCWVSGLRRAEGFEMPAAEGLVCGARPIVFDAPHYRQWYDGLADFIPEGPPEEVTASILGIFDNGFEPASYDVRQTAIERFDWKTIIPGFWERVL